MYELKRGTLTREAVTQVLDYASSLEAMSTSDLTEHIAERSGNDGIQGIDEFEQWYADNFRGDDLSGLLPPRMVLVAMGVDPVAERMAKFISGGPVDLSIVTFHGFMRGEERLLARQLEVEPGPRERRHRRPAKSNQEKHQDLRRYLEGNGYADLFDRILGDVVQLLPDRVWRQPGGRGIGLQLTEPDDPSRWKTYFGVYAGYHGSAYSVSILPQAIHWGTGALERLKESVQLSDWPHGGYACQFNSEQEWAQQRDAVLEFVNSVMASRDGDVRLVVEE